MRHSIAALLLAALATSSAKARTAKLLIMGGDLAGIVEVTDPPTLAISNVYDANFLSGDRRAAPTPPTAQRYLVQFLLPDASSGLLARVFESRKLRTAYVVYFNTSDSGYVYVPGARDAWSALNHGTIVRDTVEGHWSYANRAWAQAIEARLARANRLPAPSCPSATGQIASTDSGFRDFVSLRDSLGRRGIRVLCMYHSTFDGAYGARAAAAVITDHGALAALLFPGPAGALRISTSVARGQLLTTVRSPYTARVDSVWDLDPAYLLIHGRWLLDSFGQAPLDSALRAALVDSR